jgi:hypothetical protein
VSSVVVAVRWGLGALDTSALAVRVRGAIERASVSGGQLAGVAPDGASFAYEPSSVEEAIDLAISFAIEGGEEGDEIPRPARRAGAEPPRWRVGVAVGDLSVVRELGNFERLAVGTAASRASALARVAQPGEVLVDLALESVRAGALLGTGRRVATDRGGRLRGIVLDVHEPWRRGGAVEVERVREPRLVAREALLGTILEQVQPGGLGIVRAAPGLGGSRLLDELGRRAARAIAIGPAGLGAEPLGALRLGLARYAAERGVPSLAPRESELWTALAQGQGVELEAAADLLASWLDAPAHAPAHDEERAFVLIDDAALVDRASLEAIGFAAAAAGATFGVVARLDASDPIPAPLATLVVEADATLRTLPPHEAASVLEDACGGAAAVSRDVVKRWLRRGGGSPLGILEALRHGLATSELAAREGVIAPRSKVAGRGRALSPQAWLVRRLAALSTDRPEDALIVSLVACAGALDRAMLEEALVDLGVRTPGGPEATLERLAREGLLYDGPTFVAPASRTLRDAALARLEEKELRRLHGVLAATLARAAEGLVLAEGAHHAALAGDHLGAGALAVRAAERARRAGLDRHAQALDAFARAEGAGATPLATTPSPPRASMRSPHPGEPPRAEASVDEAYVEHEQLGDELDDRLEDHLEEEIEDFEEIGPLDENDVAVAAEADAPPSFGQALRPDVESEPPTQRARSSPPIVQVVFHERPLQKGAQDALAAFDRPSLAVPAMRTHDIEALPSPLDSQALRRGDDDDEPDGPTDEIEIVEELPDVKGPSIPPSFTPRSLREAFTEDSVPPSRPPARMPSEGPEAKLARKARDALLAGDAHGFESALNLLDGIASPNALARLRGLSAVSRGDVAKGLQLIREARASAHDERESARAALAFAIGLGALGRRDDALLEALDALAIERKLGHERGAAACRKVIERLLGAG